MTKDDIIRMAREAGFEDHSNPELWDCMIAPHNAIAHFATLVAAPLQERIQLLYEQLNEAEKQLDAQYKLGMEAEREACARVCEEPGWNAANWCAKQIRARGNA